MTPCHSLEEHQRRWVAVSERVLSVDHKAGEVRTGLDWSDDNRFHFEGGLHLVLVAIEDLTPELAGLRVFLTAELEEDFGALVLMVAATEGLAVAVERYRALVVGTAAAITGIGIDHWQLEELRDATAWFARVLS